VHRGGEEPAPSVAAPVIEAILRPVRLGLAHRLDFPRLEVGEGEAVLQATTRPPERRSAKQPTRPGIGQLRLFPLAGSKRFRVRLGMSVQ
jgi:hypothetical protein